MYSATRCVCRAIFIFLINTLLSIIVITCRSILPYWQGMSFGGFILFKRSLIMYNKMYETLEFNKVMNILEDYAVSDKAKNKIKTLEPYLSEIEVSRHLSETTDAKLIIESFGSPPLSAMDDLEKSLVLLSKGVLLVPDQLGNIAQFITTCRRLKAYLKKAESLSASVAAYGNSIYDLSDVEGEINRAIRGNQVDDKASPALADIKRKIANAELQIKSKLDSLLRNNKNWYSETFVSLRSGHYTLPVKKEFKNQIKGTVIDISQSGGTYFMEPLSAMKFQEEVNLMFIEEENEIRRILYVLTALVERHLSFIYINIEAMESLDFIFAKAKLSISMKAEPLPIGAERKIEIKAGRHPLMKTDKIVPLDFHMGEDYKGVVITGPNTGGKTVALKTIGLLSLMAQSGLHVPADDGFFTMNNYILCDIGDGQSITENLSTFSAHITNIIQILRLADSQSLILLDELGSGTDPAEGMGLAVAIIEELVNKNCLFIATTHYPEIKDFAKNTPGLINARMAFDLNSLLPLYRLEMGEAGESCALYIARRLGFPQNMIDRAKIAAYGIESDKKSGKSDIMSLVSNMPSPLIDLEVQESKIQTPDPNESPKKRITHQEIKKPGDDISGGMNFNIGDSVLIYPQKLVGIVYQKTNEKGNIGVQIKNKKILINHKRLKLLVSASELYPDNYDFSIVFESIENRKKRHDMGRKHDPSLIIESYDGEKE